MPVSSYLLEGEISYETVAPVLRWLDTQTPKHLGIDSTGGNPSAAFFLAEAVNSHVDDGIEVCIAGYCYSAAMYMQMSLYQSVPVSVCPGALGMLHYASVEMMQFPNGKTRDQDDKRAQEQMLLDYKKWVDEWARHNLNRSERSKLRSGHDVYFNYDRMKELFER